MVAKLIILFTTEDWSAQPYSIKSIWNPIGIYFFLASEITYSKIEARHEQEIVFLLKFWALVNSFSEYKYKWKGWLFFWEGREKDILKLDSVDLELLPLGM